MPLNAFDSMKSTITIDRAICSLFPINARPMGKENSIRSPDEHQTGQIVVVPRSLISVDFKDAIGKIESLPQEAVTETGEF